MKIVLGSDSDSKINIVIKFFKDKGDFSITGKKVDSGISDQPLTKEETIRGSINRAKAVLNSGKDIDIAVGLEGGLYKNNGIYNLICVATIINENGEIFTGLSKNMPLPIDVSKKVDDGKLFAEEIRLFLKNNKFNNEDSKYINELISRKEGFSEALRTAYNKYVIYCNNVK